jgi:hypothetical protein
MRSRSGNTVGLSQNLSHLYSNQNPPNLSNLLLRHIPSSISIPSQSTKNPTQQMVFGITCVKKILNLIPNFQKLEYTYFRKLS